MTTRSIRVTRALRLTAAALLLVTVAVRSSDRLLAGGQAATARSGEAAQMIRALEVHAGLTVAEIGAGGGEMTITMAREVGTSGRVYSSELGDDRVGKLRGAIETSGLSNITVVEGDPLKTNLPEGCCDALFMQNVYHHFGDPAAMNASIFQSLKPGARVAIQDFQPDHGEAERPADRGTDGHHGVTPETVRRELEAAGFTAVGQEKIGKEGFVVIVRKPTS